MRSAGRVAGGLAWLGVAVLLLPGCRLRPAHGAPSVELTEIPRADAGGTARQGTIAGRVTGASPGQRIVLYARSDQWYVQPFVDQPFTPIRPDSTWTSATHLGTEYAALVVDGDYRPAPVVSTLPGLGGGVAAIAVADGVPVFWKSRGFPAACVLALFAAGWGIHRLRVRELTRQLNRLADERLAERTQIAQELYDTLLQGFLSASMRLHLTIDSLPVGSSERQRLDPVLEVMRQATEEGRIVLQGLRSSDGEGDGLEKALVRCGHEVGDGNSAGYRVSVEGATRRLHPIVRDEVYRVGREAVANAFRHAQAQGIEVEIAYSAKALRLLVRDDGRGIEAGVFDSRTGSGGLSGMRERASRIGAELRVRSRAGLWTEVELMVPAGVAFQEAPSPVHRGRKKNDRAEPHPCSDRR
jgi:signal transduction histidine kinase